MGLELYSKIEELFLDKEAAEFLWGEFIEILKGLGVKRVLDIGCGSGEFCKMAEDFDVKGIDLSSLQVKRAKERGCDCEVKNVCEVKEKFDASVAIFDVVNYLKDEELGEFFRCVREVSEYFIFDVNTLFAFEELATGTLKADSGDKFGVLYSDFDGEKFITEITLFEKDGNCYKRSDDKIVQYYHSVEKLKKISKMKLIDIKPITLYGSEEAEKVILILKAT